MPVETEIQTTYLPPLKAPRGNELSCKGWAQEAAMCVLMNNLDEEVGERPRDLVVYGGTGKADRNQFLCRTYGARLFSTLTQP